MPTLRLALLALALLALPTVALAQPAVTPGAGAFFDHDGVNVASWGLQLDGGTWTAIAPVKGARVGTATPAVYEWSFPFPAATPGPHTLKLRACNIGGCTESDAFAFQMIVLPSKPTNIRIGTAGEEE